MHQLFDMFESATVNRLEPFRQPFAVGFPSSARIRSLILSAVIGGSVFLGAPEPSAATSYRLIDLGTLGGRTAHGLAINNAGQVAGYSLQNATTEHAFFYTGGSMIDLGIGYGRAINAAGEVTGTNAQGRPFKYSNGQLYDVGTLGGALADAYGINNAGQITGGSYTSGNTVSHAFLYSEGSMIDLGSLGPSFSQGTAINNLGQVAGYFATIADNSAGHAFLYSSGVSTDIGTLGGTQSYSTAINDAGQITGASLIAPGQSTRHAFLYSDGIMTDLGSLGGTSYGLGLNQAGDVTGYSGSRGFVYSKGSMVDLNSLLDSHVSKSWFISAGNAINDAGQIVAEANFQGGSLHSVLLTPVPEPTTCALMFAGLLLVAVISRRRVEAATTASLQQARTRCNSRSVGRSLLLGFVAVSVVACGGSDSPSPGAPAETGTSANTVGTGGGRAQSSDGRIQLDFNQGQLTGDTTFVFSALPTSPAALLAALPAAIGSDYEAVPGASWSVTVGGAGWAASQSIAASIAADPAAALQAEIAATGRARAMAVPDPTTNPTARRALVQCPDGSMHLTTPGYSDGRESFVINCPGLQPGSSQQVLNVVLVNLTSTVPAASEWTRQVGGGAGRRQDDVVSIDASGRVSMVVQPYALDSNGQPSSTPGPFLFVSYDSDGRLRGRGSFPVPTAVGTATPYDFQVFGMQSLGNGRHVLYGMFAATSADSSIPWVMAVEDTLNGASPAASSVALHELWSTRFGLPDGANMTVNNYSMAVAPDGDVLFTGTVGSVGRVDPLLQLRGPFLLRLSPTGLLRWVAPMLVPTSAGSATGPAEIVRLSVDYGGNPIALAYLAYGHDRGTSHDAGYCADSVNCVLLLKINGSDGSLLWTRDVDVSNSAIGLGLAVDATGHAFVTSFTVIAGPGREGVVLRYTPAGSLEYALDLAGTFAIDFPLAVGVSPTGALGLVYRGTLNFGSTDPLQPQQSGVFFQTVSSGGTITAPRVVSHVAQGETRQSRLFDRSSNAYAVFPVTVSDVPGGGALNLGCTDATQCSDLLVSKIR